MEVFALMDKVLRYRLNVKWFVFIEPDTYMMWPNLLEYLLKFEASKPYYICKHMYIGDVLFRSWWIRVRSLKVTVRKVLE